MMPSASANLGTHSFTASSNTHLPVSLQRLQAMQPRMALLPTCTSSHAMPAAANSSAAMASAVWMQPSLIGLPLIMSTFICVSSPLWWSLATVGYRYCRRCQWR